MLVSFSFFKSLFIQLVFAFSEILEYSINFFKKRLKSFFISLKSPCWQRHFYISNFTYVISILNISNNEIFIKKQNFCKVFKKELKLKNYVC